MNVTTEQNENCVIDLHIELPPERFKQEWERIGAEYCRLARLPGFRKGKAPLSAVEKKYAKEMTDEAIERLIKTSLREALDEKKLTPVLPPALQEENLSEDRSLRFVVRVVIKPEFELPGYQGLAVSVEKHHVSEEQVSDYLEKMRESSAEFITVEDRGLEMGDFAVLDYEGTADGKSLFELNAEMPLSLIGRHNTWLRLEEKNPIPGLASALLGLKPLESRECKVTFPQDFSQKELQGIEVVYAVKLHEIKARELPPLNDDFASKIEKGLTLENVKEKIRAHMQQSFDANFQRAVRAAVTKELLAKTPCEPPAAMVQQESNSMLQEIISDNQARGVSDEEIRAHQEQLLQSAQQTAEEKIKLNFILSSIATAEKLQITNEEFSSYLSNLAQHYKMPPQKLVKELSKRRALPAIQEEILFNKALDFIVAQAHVTELPPSKKHEEEEHHHVHGPHCNHG